MESSKPNSKAAKMARVLNKAPSEVQITAEQLLTDAFNNQEKPVRAPKQNITDPEELADFQLRKRKQYEEVVRRSATNMGTWIKYAMFENSQGKWERARNIFERALDVDPRHPQLYVKYAEFEIQNKNINSARNIWNRAVTTLPFVDNFWLSYACMEERLGNVDGAREIFDRWMKWEPKEPAWLAYINFERRHQKTENARKIFEQFVIVYCQPKVWLKYAKFEEKNGDIDRTRALYERAISELGDEFADEQIFIQFAKFEARKKELERVRAIYKYAISHLPRGRAEALYEMYTQFEKQHGERDEIEDAIVQKRRFYYEEELKTNALNYDVWFDYIRLEENHGNSLTLRDLYERAISQVPPSEEKRHWRRYIYLWLGYAYFEELQVKDYDRIRNIYRTCLELIPHKKFTFGKIWLAYAAFEVRQKQLDTARKTLGRALGMCPKEKLFKGYIELELQLREFDRCRILYGKYLVFQPANCAAWIRYAELEQLLEDFDRSRAIFELAVEQPVLDMPEVLWKAYMDFETSLDEYDKTRSLYERLLQKTEHVKVWASYADFEVSVPAADSTEREERVEAGRQIFSRGYATFKNRGLKVERVYILEEWRQYEKKHGDENSLRAVVAKLPDKVKKRHRVKADDGTETDVWEEHYDYIFPEDINLEKPNLKLLEKAKNWKKMQSAR